jgi:hypothetical protein
VFLQTAIYEELPKWRETCTRLYSPLTTSKADAGDRTALEKTVMDAAAAGDAISSASDFKPFLRLR